MNTKKFLIAAIAVWIINGVFGWLTCGWLFNWVYQLPPNIWKTSEEMSSNLVWMNLAGILSAAAFVLVFAVIYKGIPGEGAKKGLIYGFLVWLVSSFSGLITMPLYMTIATTVVIYWIINHLIISLITGAIVGMIYKEQEPV